MLKNLLLILVLPTLAACASGPRDANGVLDPYEGANRAMHAVNKGLDTVALRPAAAVYGGVLPKPVRDGVNNVANNLELPGDMINNLAQGRLDNFGNNFFRLIINTTLGIGGIFDPAKSFGLDHEDTDFGETLFVWGVPEGAYVELPVLGPSTERGVVGRVVDAALNPLGVILNDDQEDIASGVSIGRTLDMRYENRDLINSTLYESADSYAQLRLLYLQNRRFKLGDGEIADDFDPFGDPFAQ